MRDSYLQFADSQFMENSWSQNSRIERIYYMQIKISWMSMNHFVFLEKTKKSEKTQCYYCDEIIKSTEIQNHMATEHSFYIEKMHGPPKSFRCDRCKKTFLSPLSYSRLHNCIVPKGMFAQWPRKY